MRSRSSFHLRRKKARVMNRTSSSTQRKKLKQLLRIINPTGCQEMDMETLFQSVADYILLLQVKVSLLRNLSGFYDV
ncbi:hypothetical protein Pint_14277 [Pistacia integerrima]|uniref:Uncharacterized protein n=1 Tax=Pistacia integerrima TaxID=434235 RepID=A0ACC0Y5N0_9ROSI|nr:hypothetical protein Pint_14277 [Pistacia integerrima]